MKENRFECDQMTLTLMHDGELGAGDMARARAHLRECASCRGILADHRSVADALVMGVEDACSHLDTKRLDRKTMDRIRKEKIPWWSRIRDLIPSTRILIPATAVAAVIIVSVSVFTPAAARGPSAIIDSFSGDVSSVMFLETPETRQTIIWYTEPAAPLVGES